MVISIKSGKINDFDNIIYDRLRQLKSHTTKQFIKFLDYIGGTETNLYMGLALSALGVVLFSNKEGYLKYILYAAAILATYFLNPLLKAYFKRPHPDIEVDKYSFPSGHAMMAFVFYMTLLLVMHKYVKFRAGKIALWIICIVMPLLIGFSRVYLKNHYGSDIIGGYLVVGIVFMVIFSAKRIIEYFTGKKASE
ncbi:MAG: phosphatase PAP2 family protein [Ruminiclostridium sp.]